MLIPVLQEKAQKQGLPLTTVIAEVLHLIALDSLFAVPESQDICFQGGTSIHLLYGGYRYSEDLDFAGELITTSLLKQLITKSRSTIEKGTIQFLGQGSCEWRLPLFSSERRIHAVWFLFRPRGKEQKYRVKMEFARYPVYESKVMPVQSDLDVLQRRPLVMGLSQNELLAEKIAAVFGRPYLKGRDLFDLWYLSEVLGTSIDKSLIQKKLKDYRVDASKSKVEQKLQQFRTETLASEMDRFLPQRYRQQLKENSYDRIREVAIGIVESVIRANL